MDFRGRVEKGLVFNPEYVRRSMTLREQKSAYACMRKWVLITPSRVAPQDMN